MNSFISLHMLMKRYEVRNVHIMLSLHAIRCHCKAFHPDFVDQLSTSKSPQQMFGPIAKTYYANILGVDPKNIVCVSVMPCVAKKKEAEIPVLNDACGEPDVDSLYHNKRSCTYDQGC